MKRIWIILLCLLMIITCSKEIKASSIKELGGTSFNNNHESKNAIYDGLSSLVYYGRSGITIINEKGSYTISTRFEVELLEVIDLNNDEYSDYVTYQKANEFSDQIFVIDGKSGSIVSSLRLTRKGFDEGLGTIDKNSFIQKIVAYGKDKVLVVYDYSIVMIDPTNCDILSKYTCQSNIWDVEIVEDLIYLTNQDGQLIYLDNDLNYIDEIDLGCRGYEVLVYSYLEMTISLNAWDLYYDGELYVTTEQGALYKIVDNKAIRYDLVDEEFLNKYLEEIARYYSYNEYDEIVFNPTGIDSSNYMNYRIIDANKDYLLISGHILDENSINAYSSTYDQFVTVYNKKTNELKRIDFSDNCQYADACLANYNGKDAIVVFKNYGNTEIKIVVYDYDGTIIYEKTLMNQFALASCPIKVTYLIDKYYIELFNGNVFYLSADLKNESYLYDLETYEYLSNNQNFFTAIKKINGLSSSIIKYDFDLNVVWEYKNEETFNNRGFEKIVNVDYNYDDIEDYIVAIGEYDNNGYLNRCLYIIIDGKDGSVIKKNYVFNYYDYDEKGRRYNVYLASFDIKVLADYDGDFKKEIVIDNNMVSSKTFSIVSMFYPYLYAQGTTFELGDYNNDAVSELLVIDKKNASIYESKRNGYEFEYIKKNTIKINEKFDVSSYSCLLDDINNDGIKEILIPDYNSNNYEIFKIYDGKTLAYMYTLCEKGVSDYECYITLDLDVNDDGYKEIFGYTGTCYCNVLLDGKTGEFIRCYSEYEYEYEEGYNPYEVEYYHPDYLIKNTSENIYVDFTIINDSLVSCKGEYDYDRDIYMTNIHFKDKKTFKDVKVIEFPMENWGNIELIPVKYNNNYIFMSTEEGHSLVDINKGDVVATFDYLADNYIYLNEGTILSTYCNIIYLLDINKTFNINEEIAEYLDDYILSLSWTVSEDYSTMEIKDNGYLVYKGCDDNCEIKLTEGNHALTFSLSDGMGKSSTETYYVIVNEQQKNPYFATIVFMIALILSFFINLYRKIYVKKHMKEVNV